jgi:hypothetical protein
MLTCAIRRALTALQSRDGVQYRKCLRTLDEVAHTKSTIVITKRDPGFGDVTILRHPSA